MPGPRSGAGSALILLGFIMLPSVVLGVLSWRAIQSEKSYSLERLRTSYRQLANLAARQVDYQLGSLESRWIGEFDALLAASGGRPGAEHVRAFEGREPMIAHYFLLAAPGRLVYPPATDGEALPQVPDVEGAAPREREHEPFARLVARGEELEYGPGDFKGAIAAYREILAQVENPRLRAVAESHVGRAQLKDRDWAGALATYRRLLEIYPDERDLDRMYLRFLAQYQIAVALDGLGRHGEALDALLELDRDLRRRSDAITTTQYSYYEGLIQALAPRLLEASAPWERERYRAAIGALGEQSKKHISERYFVHLLEAELSEMSFRHKRYSPRIRYMTARTEGVPFLLAYRSLPDAHEAYATGLLAAEIDLSRLQEQLFSAMRSLHADTEGALAILESSGHVVIGSEAATGTLMASQALSPPFDSWQVALYLRDVPTAMRRLDLRHTLWSWLISLMLLSILVGGYLFIQRARRQARLARAQTTFVSNVTHELRTPLASIRMFAELLELQMSDPRRAAGDTRGRTRQYLGIIRQECDRLNRLIERVLDFSRMERNVKQYRMEPGDLGAGVATAVESFRPYAEARGFELGLALEDGLPPVRFDADAVSQVMLNLMTNAVQYSAAEKAIHVRVHRRGGQVLIDVADRGVGIEPRNLRRVFDEFYSTWRRMDDRTQGGLGLGLTLSREIARAHGGDISVRSEVGVGSTFTVALPELPAEGVVELEPRDEPPVEAVERLGGQRG
jgi:signal transduction histidine kinase